MSELAAKLLLGNGSASHKACYLLCQATRQQATGEGRREQENEASEAGLSDVMTSSVKERTGNMGKAALCQDGLGAGWGGVGESGMTGLQTSNKKAVHACE